MKKFETPVIGIEKFDLENIVTTSVVDGAKVTEQKMNTIGINNVAVVDLGAFSAE